MKSNSGKDSLLQTYARASLQSMDTQGDHSVIDAFLDDVSFLSIARGFDHCLLDALVKFRKTTAGNASQLVPPLPVKSTEIVEAPTKVIAAPIAANPSVQPVPIPTESVRPQVDFDVPLNEPATPSTPAPPSPIGSDQDAGAALPPAIDSNEPVASPPSQPSKSVIAFRLPNARAGETYSQAFTSLKPLPQPIVFTGITLPDDLGLKADLTTGTLSGVPASAGEFEIPIVFHFEGETSPRLQIATVPLLVNQNPKLMWKNLPSDQADIYWKPDEQCSAVTGPDLRVIAAPSNPYEGEP